MAKSKKAKQATSKENLNTNTRVVKVYSPAANGRSLKAKFGRDESE